MVNEPFQVRKMHAGELILPSLRGAIIALGNFDGIHKGHQSVIAHARQWARRERRRALVVSFDPHPAIFFDAKNSAYHLCCLNQKTRILASLQLDAMLELAFDDVLSGLAPRQFVKMLALCLGAAGVVTGADFKFGKCREGDVTTMRFIGSEYNLRCCALDPVVDSRGVSISSTRVRSAVRQGDMDLAAELLTRPFTVESVLQMDAGAYKVILGQYITPRLGHYNVRVHQCGEEYSMMGTVEAENSQYGQIIIRLSGENVQKLRNKWCSIEFYM